jgi:hypothetical protein
MRQPQPAVLLDCTDSASAVPISIPKQFLASLAEMVFKKLTPKLAIMAIFSNRGRSCKRGLPQGQIELLLFHKNIS